MPRHKAKKGCNSRLPPDPAQLGFRMPAEWEPHEATWIAWPHRKQDWPGKFAPIRWVYAEIVRHLHHSERVCILVKDGPMLRRVRWVLSKVKSISNKSISFNFRLIGFGHAIRVPSS